MEKAKQDVDRVLKGYLKNRKLNILNLVDDKPPRIIYKVEKYDKKRLASKSDSKKDYFLNGMKCLLVGEETVDNYAEVLNSYRRINQERNEHIKKLFEEIKVIKKLKV